MASLLKGKASIKEWSVCTPRHKLASALSFCIEAIGAVVVWHGFLHAHLLHFFLVRRANVLAYILAHVGATSCFPTHHAQSSAASKKTQVRNTATLSLTVHVRGLRDDSVDA